MRDDRWQHLLQMSFRIDEQCERASVDPVAARLIAALDDVLEVFPSSVDPVEEFEAFAVRRFAAALRRSVDCAGRR